MIDIHAHIIPGVDDGSKSMEMSREMMLMAYEQGVRAFFATPHSSAFDRGSDKTMESFWELQAMVKDFLPDVDIYLGCEVTCEPRRMDRVKKALFKGQYPTMNTPPYVLIKFPMNIAPEDTLPCIKALRKVGWKPIIAHMEHYERLVNNSVLAEQLRETNCLIQINACSLYDEADENIKSWARQLIRGKKWISSGRICTVSTIDLPWLKMALNGSMIIAKKIMRMQHLSAMPGGF